MTETPRIPDETLSQPTDTTQPDEQKAQSPSEKRGPEAALTERLMALDRREAELTLRERRFLAMERLGEMSLPKTLLAHLDLSSGEALENSLKLAFLASKGAPEAAPVPRAAPALKPPPFATYLERAKLFEEDPAAYALMRGQSENMKGE